jgi:outer membrane lipoprotein-sorting protein
MKTMQFTMRHPGTRWLAPVAVAAVVVGSASLAHIAAASPGSGGLPDMTAQELITRVQGAVSTPVSGTVTETADLGLPDLSGLTRSGPPGGGASATSGLMGLATGSHTLRVWYGGPGKQRVALLSSLGETDLIHDGRQLWTWDSSDNSVTHRELPAAEANSGASSGASGSPTANPGGAATLGGADMPTTPGAAAAAALSLIGPTTSVSVSNDASAAGRDAYQLTLTPKGTGSLVSAIRIDVDGSTFVPLRVEVDSASTGAAAFTIGFSSPVSFAPIDPAQFTFSPPPGATVTTESGGSRAGSAPGLFAGLKDHADVQVVGSGWTSVVVARATGNTAGGAPGTSAGTAPTQGAGSTHGPTMVRGAGGTLGALGGLLHSLPTVSGSWGSGRILAGTLFTVLITDSGTIAAGAVTPAIVTAALAH